MMKISPRINLKKDPDCIGEMMFSNGSVDKMEEGTPEVLLPLEENPHVKSLKNKERFYKDKEGQTCFKS